MEEEAEKEKVKAAAPPEISKAGPSHHDAHAKRDIGVFGMSHSSNSYSIHFS
jgi:hypothetical protein